MVRKDTDKPDKQATVKQTSSQTEPKRFVDLLRDYWQTYCEKSTIHCVRYLYDPNLHNIERVIWCALLITCVTLTCIFYLLLAERYGAQKLETVVEDPQFPVFYLAFPAVGVCTVNRINWSKFDEAKALFMPSNASRDSMEAFTTVVSRMETMRFGNFHPTFDDLEDLDLQSLEFLNLTNLAMFMALQCEDILLLDTCTWRGMPFNCCDYFVLESTEYGFCLVYNSELSPTSNEIRKRKGPQYYPMHNSKAGPGTGLRFVLQTQNKFKRPNSTASDNIFIMLKQSIEISSTVYSMIPNTETFMTVRVELTNTDESTRKLPPEKRNCRFPDEQEYNIANKDFSRSFLLTNCLTHCHETYLAKLCNCSIPIFFLNSSRTMDCNAVHLPCLARHNDMFSYDKSLEEDRYFSYAKPGMTCNCLVNCNLVEYFASMTTLPLSPVLQHKNDSVQLFIVDIHYETEIIVKYRTSLQFTTIDLIANFGGIFGLCLGASMVSAVELLYYTTIGFGLYLYDNNYYLIFRNAIKRKWHNWLLYLRNEVEEVGTAAAPKSAEQDIQYNKKMRHPFNHKENFW